MTNGRPSELLFKKKKKIKTEEEKKWMGLNRKNLFFFFVCFCLFVYLFIYFFSFCFIFSTKRKKKSHYFTQKQKKKARNEAGEKKKKDADVILYAKNGKKNSILKQLSLLVENISSNSRASKSFSGNYIFLSWEFVLIVEKDSLLFFSCSCNYFLSDFKEL